MKKKYKKYPMPIEAWLNFKSKQKRMSESFKAMTGKSRKIPLSSVILLSSKSNLWLDDDELKNISKRRFKI